MTIDENPMAKGASTGCEVSSTPYDNQQTLPTEERKVAHFFAIIYVSYFISLFKTNLVYFNCLVSSMGANCGYYARNVGRR